ncbi:hypothetical protein ACQKMI_21255 [Lysinibacillus sp. NPDC097214]|uniref:hypothetical protein n=1 Tax=Lysinibacillus sp. NPDC097214 TaxID=3390584 RepID=UPI003CFDA831
MRKLVISILVFVLVFSELNVFVAETIVNDPTEPEIECEEQLETDDVENIATECKEPEKENGEDPTTEGEGQPETENSGEDPTTEGKEQPESESGEDPTTEGKEQPEPENGEDLTTEGEKEQEPENGENPSTEEEEQTESETEENLANACENQLETDGEENPATEGEEQQPETDSEKDPEVDCEEEPAGEEKPEIECEEGFYIEEEPAVEGEEQLESNNEEELAVEGEEQLEPNDEEEPAVEGEEQLEPNDEEEPAIEGEKQQAPQCKRAISKLGKGIRLRDVDKIGDIDFSKLDDSENELDGFTQMTENRGVEFKVQGEKERKHYMYFGDVYNGRSIESLEVKNSYKDPEIRDDWGRPLPDMETTLESLVSGKDYINAQTFQVMITLGLDKSSEHGVATYFYSEGRAKSDKKGNGLVIAQGGYQSDVAQFQSVDLPILKLYKNERTKELIAYAAVINDHYTGLYLDGYVKINMRPMSSKGRINVSMKYLKLSDEYEYTNFGYSVHMDIAMKHQESRMYSLGNEKGFYFNQPMIDSRNYLLYFFRDGYENHPVKFEGTDYPVNKRPFGIPENSYYFFNRLNSSPKTNEPGKDVMYPFTDHPGWALRWDPKIQKLNEVRSASIEIAVSETKINDVLPEVQLDNDGEYTEGGYRIGGTWKAPDSEYISLYYTIDGGKPEKIQDFKNVNPDIATPWEFMIPIAEGLDHDVTIYAIDEYDRLSNIETIKLRPTLAITEQVLNEDGNVPTEVAPGETLNYEILVNTGYGMEDKGTYGGVTITQKYDPHLKQPPTDLKITDENDNTIGTVTFNASNNEIVAKPNADLRRSTKVKVTYKAKVKEEATEKEYVRGQAIISGKYSTGDAVNQTSNEVKIMIIGVLKFVSAPQTISFGDKLTISPRTKTYYPIPITLDESLAVKDSRPQSRNPSWTMTAKLIQPLTGKGTGSTLEGFRYRFGENVSFLSTNASVQIYNKKTTNSEVVNISNTWNPDGDGLYLEVLPGTAKVGVEYEGIISWTLHDVQPNE